jgi:hypothetical protein
MSTSQPQSRVRVTVRLVFYLLVRDYLEGSANTDSTESTLN